MAKEHSFKRVEYDGGHKANVYYWKVDHIKLSRPEVMDTEPKAYTENQNQK